MAVAHEQRLITPISQRKFELYALSLERGPNFDPAHIFGAYRSITSTRFRASRRCLAIATAAGLPRLAGCEVGSSAVASGGDLAETVQISCAISA
jgi:hypothetical protein